MDEDPQNPVDASAGEILVYDPDLEPLRDEQGNIRRIDIRSLPCVDHNRADGLRASLEGLYHGVIVRVPVSFVQKSGSYHFVIRAWDNHAHLHKDHQVKPALGMNAVASTAIQFDLDIADGQNGLSSLTIWRRQKVHLL
jgi:hypothetical protein